MQFQPLLQMRAPKSRLLITALAAIGAGFIVASPSQPAPSVQHRAVQLAAGAEEVDYATLVASTQANLTTLQTEAATANTELSSALGALSSEYTAQVNTAITGFDTGVQNAIDGGWYGGDDGYVDGLFAGTIVGGPEGSVQTIGTLAEISNALSSGNYEQAFSYYDLFSLEALDHTLKPLLNPLLDVTSHGATTLSIPVELSQLQTNFLETFGTYTELKQLGDALLAPGLGAGFGYTQDLDKIATDLSPTGAGDAQALTDFNNLSSDVLNDLFNGFSTGSTTGESTFTGLLNSGSLAQELLVTWPTQLATVLTESTTPAAAESVSTVLPDLFSGLF